MTFLMFIGGLVFLIVGAELLVKGASRLATSLGISTLIIGLTVVAFGTSSPELAVSLKSSLTEQSDIAMGNIVGSNIFNILFTLGLSALIKPLIVSQQLIRFDIPLMIVVSFIVYIIAMDGQINRIDGAILTMGIIMYSGFLIYKSRLEHDQNEGTEKTNAKSEQPQKNQWVLNLFLIASGLGLLTLGSRWLVDSAVIFAKQLGVSELVIGLTIIALGTSLPEVVTSIIAAIHGERDIAVGNIIGSNLFNLMFVLGLTGLFVPQGIEVASAVINFDLPIMLAVSVACLPLFFSGNSINRAKGALLFGYYIAYTMYLLMAATHHDALPQFSGVMLYFVIPITAVTIFGIAFHELRNRWLRQTSKALME